MTFLDHLRAPRFDRDAAFDAALRDGRLPPRDRCPYCGQAISADARFQPAMSDIGALADRADGHSSHELSVDEELHALSNGRSTS